LVAAGQVLSIIPRKAQKVTIRFSGQSLLKVVALGQVPLQVLETAALAVPVAAVLIAEQVVQEPQIKVSQAAVAAA
jgi:hypothetical protein